MACSVDYCSGLRTNRGFFFRVGHQQRPTSLGRNPGHSTNNHGSVRNTPDRILLQIVASASNDVIRKPRGRNPTLQLASSKAIRGRPCSLRFVKAVVSCLGSAWRYLLGPPSVRLDRQLHARPPGTGRFHDTRLARALARDGTQPLCYRRGFPVDHEGA